jgi:hypothetical protein
MGGHGIPALTDADPGPAVDLRLQGKGGIEGLGRERAQMNFDITETFKNLILLSRRL